MADFPTETAAAPEGEAGEAAEAAAAAVAAVERGELIAPGSDEEEAPRHEAVEQPAKVMRIGSMIKQLLEEVRAAGLDEGSRQRLREIYDTSVIELTTALSPDLQSELERLTHPFEGQTPSDAELRVAKAQLVGWLEGLFHGIQATLFAQQMAARQQLEDMRGRQLGQGGEPSGESPGTYL